MQRGTFVTVEGPNFAGKSTFIAALVACFQQAGRSTLLFREPGGSAYGEVMRPTLKGSDLTDFSRALGFNSVRAQNVSEIIVPALDCGKVVIADRYFDSTAVYQIHMGTMTAEQQKVIEQVHAAMVQPDLTVFLLPCVELIHARKSVAARSAEVDIFEGAPNSEVAAYRQVAAAAKRAGRSVICIEYDASTQNKLLDFFLSDFNAQRLLAAA